MTRKLNYRIHIRSIIWSVSSIHNCLHQKSKDTIQFHLTLWMGLDLSSKHLAFLSLYTDHHIHEGINLHHLFWLLLPPLLIQQLRRSWCMFRHGPATASNVEKQSPQLSSALAVQQKVLICLFSHHTKHLGTNCLFFFCSTSWVRQALLITNQVKHLTLVGMLLFQK